MRLYQLPAAFAEVEAMTLDGELTPEAIEKLGDLEGELEYKIESCCKVMRHFETDAAAYRQEADRLYKHAQVAESNAKRIRGYMQMTMEELGQERIETQLFKVRLQKNPASVSISPEVSVELLPDEFVTKTVIPSKSAILAAHKEGKPIPAGISVLQTTGLRVS